jgi:hypothetical protein
MTRPRRRRNPGDSYIVQIAVPSADGYLRTAPFDYDLPLDQAARLVLEPPAFVKKKLVKGTYLLVAKGESAPPDLVATPKGRKGMVLATETGFSLWEPGAGAQRIIHGKEIGLTTIGKAGAKKSQWRVRREYDGWSDDWFGAWEKWDPAPLLSLIYSCSPGPAAARLIAMDIAEQCFSDLAPENAGLFTRADLDMMRRYNGAWQSAAPDDIEGLRLKAVALANARSPDGDWLGRDVRARGAFRYLIVSIFRATVGEGLYRSVEDASMLLGTEPVRKIIHEGMTFPAFIWGAVDAQRRRLLLKKTN